MIWETECWNAPKSPQENKLHARKSVICHTSKTCQHKIIIAILSVITGPKEVRSNYNHTSNCSTTFQQADLPHTCYKCLLEYFFTNLWASTWHADPATSSSYPFLTLASQSTIQWVFWLAPQELSCRPGLWYFMLVQIPKGNAWICQVCCYRHQNSLCPTVTLLPFKNTSQNHEASQCPPMIKQKGLFLYLSHFLKDIYIVLILWYNTTKQMDDHTYVIWLIGPFIF